VLVSVFFPYIAARAQALKSHLNYAKKKKEIMKLSTKVKQKAQTELMSLTLTSHGFRSDQNIDWTFFSLVFHKWLAYYHMKFVRSLTIV